MKYLKRKQRLLIFFVALFVSIGTLLLFVNRMNSEYGQVSRNIGNLSSNQKKTFELKSSGVYYVISEYSIDNVEVDNATLETHFEVPEVLKNSKGNAKPIAKIVKHGGSVTFTVKEGKEFGVYLVAENELSKLSQGLDPITTLLVVALLFVWITTLTIGIIVFRLRKQKDIVIYNEENITKNSDKA